MAGRQPAIDLLGEDGPMSPSRPTADLVPPLLVLLLVLLLAGGCSSTEDPYPGDRLSQVRSRDFCSDSVGAWMNYPVDYEFGYTWFHEGEWRAGNRRSICWAKTDR